MGQVARMVSDKSVFVPATITSKYCSKHFTARPVF